MTRKADFFRFSVVALGFSITTIFLEALEQSWWQDHRLPPVALQSLVYGLIILFLLTSGSFLWLSIRRINSRLHIIFLIITSTVWLLALAMFIRLVGMLKAAIALGTSPKIF